MSRKPPRWVCLHPSKQVPRKFLKLPLSRFPILIRRLPAKLVEESHGRSPWISGRWRDNIAQEDPSQLHPKAGSVSNADNSHYPARHRHPGSTRLSKECCLRTNSHENWLWMLLSLLVVVRESTQMLPYVPRFLVRCGDADQRARGYGLSDGREPRNPAASDAGTGACYPRDGGSELSLRERRHERSASRNRS
jgi:hypothetical protein